MDVISQPSPISQKKIGLALRWGSRGVQIFLNLLGVVACFIIISDLRQNTTWQVGTWLSIMLVQLILSASGMGLYFFSKLCKSQESWTIISAAYNMIQSHVILYAYLVGSQDIISKYWKAKPNTRFSKHMYAALLGALICQVNSMYHFIYAFFPGPIPFRGASKNDSESSTKDAAVPEILIQTPSNSNLNISGNDSLTETVDSFAMSQSTIASEPDSKTNTL